MVERFSIRSIYRVAVALCKDPVMSYVGSSRE